MPEFTPSYYLINSNMLTRWLPWLLCFCVECAHAVPSDTEEPIHIQSENAEFDQENERFIYVGSVQINQGTLQVNAEQMIVDVREKRVVRITATGSPAHYLQQLPEAEGMVRADAETIVYHTQTERIDLKGDAHLTQKGNHITGQLIQYDMVAGKVDATSNDETPVKMVLQPASPDPLE